MSSSETARQILAAKARLKLNWADIAQGVGMSEVYTTSVCLGMNPMSEDKAQALCNLLDLDPALVDDLVRCPYRTWDYTVPQDPVIYRMYEIVGVYGATVKELIHEKFGDGIMSAIDYQMDIDRKDDPKGDRVVITMDGKFLPYRRW
ncbi:MAG: cyanase [Halofilum sp. (in: g-proteobacteria)]